MSNTTNNANTTPAADLTTGTIVETPKGAGIVTEVKPGWFLVKLADDTSISFRASSLTIVDAADDNPDGHARIKPDWSKLTKVRAASGKRSFDNNDSVAVTLRGLELDEALEACATILTEQGEPTTGKALMAKYSHLNPGHIRMCAGNKARAAIKRGLVAEAEAS